MRRIVFCLALALVAALIAAAERSPDHLRATKQPVGDKWEPPRFSEQTRRVLTQSRFTAAGQPRVDQAAALLLLAAKKDDEQAFVTLQQIVALDLPMGEQEDRIRASAHERLADYYPDRPSKQVRHLGLALLLSPDAQRRTRLESRILDLGADPFAVRFWPEGSDSIRSPGADDSCAGAPAVTIPHTEVTDITPYGDHNWRAFDLTGPDGAIVRIETISDLPGSGSDDTDLGLWDGCPVDGGTLLAFNDDKPTDFTSRIDSACLAPGTYYVEVGGFEDYAEAFDVTLEIETIETCTVPAVDGFEPDDQPGQAASIGLPTSTPGHAHGWGRSRKEIQARAIFPANDTDHATFRLELNERVRMSTASVFPTFFNGFETRDPQDNPDTTLRLDYAGPVSYGGRCNQPGFLPFCYSDQDCPDPLIDPPVLWPLPCIELHHFMPWGYDPALAINADRGPSDRGSELSMCLPRTSSNSPSATLQRWGGDFLVDIRAQSRTEFFSYELQVRNDVGCLFEHEPNNAFEDANPIEPGPRIAGFYDFLATNPYADSDLYRFDVEQTTRLVFETFGPDTLQSDTALTLFVGPDDFGSYYYTADDDDSGSGFLSRLETVVPPASEMLGNTTADADWFIEVTTNYANPNFYYELAMTEVVPLPLEVEPNDSTAAANALSLGQRISARIDQGCDVDTFRFELEQDTFVTLTTPSGGDAAIQLVRCDSADDVLGCDDDSGGALLPLVEGCLSAGSYCATVRAFSGSDTFAYDLELRGTPGCSATDPPAMTGDRSFSCLDFASCP